MAQSVLKFVSELDLSDLQLEKKNVLPYEADELLSIESLNLERLKLNKLPQTVYDIKKLENLYVSDNELTTIPRGTKNLQALQTLVARRNQLTHNDVRMDNPQMKVLDLSFNNLTHVPSDIYSMRSLVVLSLRNNKLKALPADLFMDLPSLQSLDVSHNDIESFPPQIRRLTQLVTLDIGHNPLAYANLRTLCALTQLKTIKMCNTGRTVSNMPELQALESLEVVDLAHNALTAIPSCLYMLDRLQTLGLANNNITSFHLSTDSVVWPLLRLLDLSCNALKQLPENIGILERLQKLFLSDNALSGSSLPESLGHLQHLHTLRLDFNPLEALSEETCESFRNLRALHLQSTQLSTLPEIIYDAWENLQVLDVHGNVGLKMPRKVASEDRFYHVDFSRAGNVSADQIDDEEAVVEERACVVTLQTKRADNKRPPSGKPVPGKLGSKSAALQLKLGSHSSTQTPPYQPENEATEGKDTEKACNKSPTDRYKDTTKETVGDKLAMLARDEERARLKIDCAALFTDDSDADGGGGGGGKELGQEIGVRCWAIDNFTPLAADECLYGGFYQGDAYILLHTYEKNDKGDLDYDIWYWVGSEAKMDKVACVAMHSVNLRNQLGIEGKSTRVEEGDEPDEFLEMLPVPLCVQKGQGTASSFYENEQEGSSSVRLYRIFSGAKRTMRLELTQPTWSCMASDQVYLLDQGQTMRLWYGNASSDVQRQKARLLVQKIIVVERNAEANLIIEYQNKESQELSSILDEHLEEDDADDSRVFRFGQTRVQSKYTPDDGRTNHVTKLYRVEIANRLLRVTLQKTLDGLTPSLLKPEGVYILDCYNELFLWVGRASTRLLRAAGGKLLNDLIVAESRPDYIKARRVTMFAEPEVFKCKFEGWTTMEDRNQGSKLGSSLNVYKTPPITPPFGTWKAPGDKPAIDIQALFRRELLKMDDADALQTMSNYNYDLESMLVFRFVQGKLSRVPEADHGTFFSGECYIFLCIYWKEEENSNAKYEQDSESEDDEEAEDEFEAILYFWTGRDAPSNLWPRFTLQHAPQLMDLVKKKYKCDLEIRRTFQQRETERFLSHFRRKCILYQGKYTPGCEYKRARLFQVRQMSSIITQRTVEVPLKASVLDSAYCFILVAPHEKRPGGVIYVWIGRQTNDADAQTAMTMSTIISRAFDNTETPTARYVVRVAPENGEHPSFLRLLSYSGNAMAPDRENPAPVRYSAGSMRCLVMAPGLLPDYDLKRLFRCSNRTGSFVVSEISQDFCQDDLDHNDCFLLDSRRRVYLWVGKDTSDVVQKLALKSAQTFVVDQGDGYPRDGVEKVYAGEESLEFQRFFHGWWPEAKPKIVKSASSQT